MMLDGIQLHHLMCDHLNLNVDLSSTDIIEMSHTSTSLDVIVTCGEIAKTPKSMRLM